MITPRILAAIGALGAILGIVGSLVLPDIRTMLRRPGSGAPSLSASVVQRHDPSGHSSRHSHALVSFINDRRAGGALTQESEADIERVIDSWLREDPIACIEFLGDAAPALLDAFSVSQAIINIAGHDPASRIVYSLRISNPAIQEMIIRAATVENIEDDPSGAITTISLVPQHLRYGLEIKVAETLVAQEKFKSLKLALSHPDSTNALVGHVLDALGNVDPVGALWAIRELDDSELTGRGGEVTKESSYSRMFRNAEPKSAMAFLQELPQTGYTINQTHHLVTKMLENDPGRSAELVGKYPNALMIRTAALNTAIKGVLRDPLASALLVNSIPGEQMRETAVREIVSEIRYTTSSKNVEAVARFVEALEDPLSKKVGQEALAARHVEVDLEEKGMSSP